MTTKRKTEAVEDAAAAKKAAEGAAEKQRHAKLKKLHTGGSYTVKGGELVKQKPLTTLPKEEA